MEANKKTWITDANGNRCSVECWGSEEAARKALNSLKDCYGCHDCSGCSDCYRCYGCSGCSRCSRCYGCSDCYRCSGCSRCSCCYGCSDCSDLKSAKPEQSSAETIQVPIIPGIHKAVYAAASSPKALEMSTWHTCKDTHCRAGWVVTLAGEAGKKLEARFDTVLAAMKIYDASDPNFKINPCRFFDSNEDALADMKRLAEANVGESK